MWWICGNDWVSMQRQKEERNEKVCGWFAQNVWEMSQLSNLGEFEKVDISIP